MQMAIEPGTPGTPGLVGSRARQSRSPVPLCFAQRQAVGIIVESLALRDRPPLDSNRGQCKLDSEQQRIQTHQLTVLHEAGFDMTFLQDAGRDQGGWSVADGPRHQLAVLLRKF